MKKILAVLLVAIMLLCMLPVTAFAAGNEITSVSLGGLEVPIIGDKPTTTAASDYPDKYKVKSISWEESDEDGTTPETTMTDSHKFREGRAYWAFLTLEAQGNYVFAQSITGTINGKTANTHYKPTNNGKNIVVYIYFGSAKNGIKNIDLTTVMPVIGKYPTFGKVNTAQYYSTNFQSASNCTNGITWTNQSSNINLTISNIFKENVKYQLTYYLAANEGYAFSLGAKATINGKTADVAVIQDNYAVVSLSDIVPGDGKREISSLDLSITAPKEGEKPSYTKIDGTGYYSDNGINGKSTKIYKNGIAFYKSASSYISPGTTETFKGGTEYTVKIALTPKDGYKFAKNLTAKINGKTATVETFDDGSVNVSVKLTALKKDHKHTESAWKSDATNHWKVCTDKDCGSITTEKADHIDKNNDNKCDVCGYKITKTETTSTPESTTSTPATENNSSQEAPTASEEETTSDTDVTIGAVEEEQEEEAEDNSDDGKDDKSFPWIWVIIAVVVVAAGAVTAVVVLKKRK